MNIKPVLLWSDLLLFILLACGIAAALVFRRSPPQRAAWARVGRSGTGMAAAVVLGLFLLVGVLDSLHYRIQLPTTGENQSAVYGVEVYSALDGLLLPLKERTEKTYSAPLATHLFAKESLVGEGGREYPRLTHGGIHLMDEAMWSEDLLRQIFLGLGLGLLLWTFLAALLGPPMRRRGLAWRSVLAVLLTTFLAGGVIGMLAQGYHVLGTDKVGQDVLYLTLKSIRTGLLIGTLTTLVTLPLAVFLGVIAGYAGGWVDDGIQYLYTTLNSIPGVLLIAAAILMIQVLIDTHPDAFSTAAERADARLLALCLILGMTSWTGLARLLRAETLKLRELEYVQAARAFGVSPLAVMVRHIIPNLGHIVLIALVMDFSGLVLAEAVLSYVGIGVDPSTISFGTMINAARMELAREPMVWWTLAGAFLFMFLLVLAANLLADAVRDAFDPRSVP
ncbi:ABC transporter permease [Denitratisoma oestradiolicum]|uniref:Peptide ABC transporter permease n=1 Tax=Denitratisoma oestradiolicum TaxID=311182 RepID=A0A6S6XXP2_9PROT|nr:ABC transporter permease [Denitratisoma oestradiolicum]TWO81977.1 peptide ABC transporter permease [Denitratisoma oestradiolicum]CAB1368887.1 Peptide ABC transporter permease [Denitratisoma oestradiolicum]